jgi:phosphoribosylglycinamide formyltransferase-1
LKKLSIGVFVSGSGTTLQSIIDASVDGTLPVSIKAVYSNKIEAYGLKRAEENHIPTITPLDLSGNTPDEKYQDLLNQLKGLGVELIVLAGFLRILPEFFIKEFTNKIINVHPSLIPAFCGTGMYGDKVHTAVLEYGVKVSGATVHFVDGGTDTGPIILQKPIDISSINDIKGLEKAVRALEKHLLLEAIKLIAEERVKVEGRRVYIFR